MTDLMVALRDLYVATRQGNKQVASRGDLVHGAGQSGLVASEGRYETMPLSMYVPIKCEESDEAFFVPCKCLCAFYRDDRDGKLYLCLKPPTSPTGVTVITLTSPGDRSVLEVDWNVLANTFRTKSPLEGLIGLLPDLIFFQGKSGRWSAVER